MTETTSIKSKVFHLEIITPIFLSSADGETPELRAPSFKGCMRYWWRAAVAEKDVEKLYREEAGLFGSSAEGAGRSPLTIRAISKGDLAQKKYQPLPHISSGNKAFEIPGLCPGREFELHLHARGNLDLYADILELALLLGGVGKRSRRGFGSVVKTDWCFSDRQSLMEHIYNKLQAITGDSGFEIREDGRRERVIARGDDAQKRGGRYPWIREIFIGRMDDSWEALVRRIGQATHDHSDPSLGSASPRMASPVYVSAIKLGSGYAPVVTTLNPQYPKHYKQCDLKKLEQFKGAL
ncbi:MAG: type III-B CRISPR module RAMP protein Cmr1 [Actinobacteria bacterium]|nr:type III-B CRISPR module RAMP protein Cmr1 [Actinomycetota bacterium]